MSTHPGSWGGRLLGWCFGILLGAIALYCAVKLIEAILPALMIGAGCVGVVAVGFVLYVVISAIRNRW